MSCEGGLSRFINRKKEQKDAEARLGGKEAQNTLSHAIGEMDALKRRIKKEMASVRGVDLRDRDTKDQEIDNEQEKQERIEHMIQKARG